MCSTGPTCARPQAAVPDNAEPRSSPRPDADRPHGAGLSGDLDVDRAEGGAAASVRWRLVHPVQPRSSSSLSSLGAKGTELRKTESRSSAKSSSCVHRGEGENQGAQENDAGPAAAHQNFSGNTSATIRKMVTRIDKINPTKFAGLTASPPPWRSRPRSRRPGPQAARTARHACETPAVKKGVNGPPADPALTPRRAQ
jgi:hypothetical protein